VVAAINASPESFFAPSVAQGRAAVCRAVELAVAAGADAIDLGAMSTAPYKETRISEQEECDRMGEAVAAARECCGLPISADTARAAVARVALAEGADAINDVTGLHGDPAMAEVVAASHAGLIVMANECQLGMPASPAKASKLATNGNRSTPVQPTDRPIEVVRQCLERALAAAARAGIDPGRIVIDPGLGFFRNQSLPWNEWDLAVLGDVDKLTTLGRPLMVAASRKSFLGALLDRPDPRDRLAGSLAAAVWSASRGASLVRTHDVAETRDALKLWTALAR
jgi:dihydropteroate synthase